MTEALRTRAVAVALGIGLLLTLLTGFGGVVAAVCGVLAQPAFALAVSWLRRSRTRRELAALPPYLLKDIGINEADRYQEVSKPFWQQ